MRGTDPSDTCKDIRAKSTRHPGQRQVARDKFAGKTDEPTASVPRQASVRDPELIQQLERTVLVPAGDEYLMPGLAHELDWITEEVDVGRVEDVDDDTHGPSVARVPGQVCYPQMHICMLANARAVHTQRWAQALEARGHRVTVVSIRAADIPGVSVLTVRVGPENSANRLWTLLSYLRLTLTVRQLVRRLAPDVVNAHYCVTHGVIAAFAGLRPRVVNIWGSDVMSGVRTVGRRTLIRYSITRADALVSTGQTMLAHVRAIVPELPPAFVVPFGVDTSMFAPSPNHGGDRGIVVGFVKAFRGRYAPDAFIRAAALALRDCPELRFVMAGDGPLRTRCMEFASNLGIARYIAFPGRVPHAGIPSLMRNLDVLVNCSVNESFGVVVCEAAACKVPVIATDVGGIRETVIDGATGRLVRTGDIVALARSMVELARDSGLRARWGDAGRGLVVSRYEWTECVTRMETVLAQFANR